MAFSTVARTLLYPCLVVFLTASAASAQTTRVVDDDGLGSAASCDDNIAALTQIQTAIDLSSSSDTVLVCPGVYQENINFKGKAIRVRSAAGPATTAIDGGRLAPVVSFGTSEPVSALLEGFTIRNGWASGTGGGGVRIESASPTIRGNVIIANASCGEGGGILVAFGNAVIEGNTIRDNFQSQCSGGVGGGGIAIRGFGAAIVRGNTIADNFFGTGAAISMFAAGFPRIERNLISGNRATSDGGAMWMVNGSNAVIAGNVIVGNRAARGGAISWTLPSNTRVLVVNNTIADNIAPTGAELYLEGFDDASAFYNNIIAAPPNSSAITCSLLFDPTFPSFRNNLVFSNGLPNYVGCSDQTGIQGNISADPRFLDAAAGDYHLRGNSPAIDAAFATAPEVLTIDIDGDPRVMDGNSDGAAVLDIGADEAFPSPAAMALDSPADGVVRSSFVVAGWAIDGQGAGSGVDAVHVWAQPEGGGAPTFLGVAQYGLARPDIGALFHDSRFTNSGFSLTVPTLLRPGTYVIVAYAHSVANGFAMARSARITIRTLPVLAVENDAAPVRSTFTLSGWAVDLGSGDGPGVDAVHAYAFPAGGAPIFLGAAVPSIRRDDVAAALGSALFRDSGWAIEVSLPPGQYQLAIYAHSRVAQAFNNVRFMTLTVLASMPLIRVDAPLDGATVTSPFHLTGWAADAASGRGPGIDAVHVYAFPDAGGSPVLLGAATLGIRRDDVAAALGGPQFADSGWALDATLPPGRYRIAVYARSTITGAFSASPLRLLTVAAGSQ